MQEVSKTGNIPRGSYYDHQELVKKICVTLQKEYPEMLIFQQHVGLFYRRNGTPISIGTKGMSDIYFLLPCQGLLTFGSIEVKTGRSRLSKHQKNYKKQIEKRGGLFVEARSLDGTLTAVKEYYDAK